ncbi:MAG: DUF4340 domain-containing protein [Wenzhouxiangellaceae bacterium]|nr:DUF4340 domain-containing protein [Wenzhouxiangellaceae bacterium]
MKRSQLIVLAALTLAVIVMLQLLSEGSGTAGDGGSEPLVPGLQPLVNEISAIDIVAPGGAVGSSLVRDDEHWRVEQKDGYRADFDQIAALLRNLAAARTVAAKTANPDWHARLGVADLERADASGRRIDFPGRDLVSVIIGQTDATDSGSYARRAAEAQSWLIDQVVEAPVDPVAWLDAAIMDIPSGEIREVLVRRAEGETIRIQRAEPDTGTEFVLRNVPEGRSAGAAWRRATLANGLAALNLEDVRRFEPPLPDDTARVLFVTSDGLNFILELFEDAGRYWAHITVSAETTAAEPDAVDAEPGAGADSVLAEVTEVGAEVSDENGKASGENAAAERLANAVAADARLSPWLFAIPQRRYEDLTRALEDYLEPVDESGAETDKQAGS